VHPASSVQQHFINTSRCESVSDAERESSFNITADADDISGMIDKTLLLGLIKKYFYGKLQRRLL